MASVVALCPLNIPVETVFDLDCEVENAWEGLGSQLGHYMAPNDKEALYMPCKILAVLRNDVKKGVKENFPHAMQIEEKKSHLVLALLSEAGRFSNVIFFPSNFFFLGINTPKQYRIVFECVFLLLAFP